MPNNDAKILQFRSKNTNIFTKVWLTKRQYKVLFFTSLAINFVLALI